MNWNELQIRNENIGVESYFIKVTKPSENRGVWIKYTFLKWKGSITFRVWLTLFGPDAKPITVSNTFHINDVITLGKHGIKWPGGQMLFDSGTYGYIGDISWDFRWDVLDDKPIKLLPDFLYSNEIPTTKLITPYPKLDVYGTVSDSFQSHFTAHDGGLVGMQGHNWGKKHSKEYVWLHGHFAQGIVEGFSTSIFPFKFTSICMRENNGKDHLFSDILSPFRINSNYDADLFEWKANTRKFKISACGRVTSDFAKLTYRNPDATCMYCHNDNLARTYIRLVHDRGEMMDISDNVSLEFLTKKPIYIFEVR